MVNFQKKPNGSVTVVPSLLSCDRSDLLSAVRPILSNFSVALMHVDAMDGRFVPSFGLCHKSLSNLRRAIECSFASCPQFAVHLMVRRPSAFWHDFAAVGASEIAIHFECDDGAAALARQIKSAGVRCCLAINPETKFSSCVHLLEHFSSILIMGVKPGFGGQDILPWTVEKVRTAADHRSSCGLKYDICVDGGVRCENAANLAEAGADRLIAGSAIFRSSCQKTAYGNLVSLLGG
ncbi:MAG: ribulose-phosphate 3-epimerase [Puniceicoccales bacterium]|jgi:ribulose-phosphate 3-epimerase|nr:ribulose-phosphate 3-epimerase [Puniceicoccales bacterium]